MRWSLICLCFFSIPVFSQNVHYEQIAFDYFKTSIAREYFGPKAKFRVSPAIKKHDYFLAKFSHECFTDSAYKNARNIHKTLYSKNESGDSIIYFDKTSVFLHEKSRKKSYLLDVLQSTSIVKNRHVVLIAITRSNSR